MLPLATNPITQAIKTMKISTLGLAALSLTLLAANSVRADDTGAPYFKKGDVLLEFNASFNHAGYQQKHEDDDDDSGSVNFFYAEIGASYFLTDHISSGAETFGIIVPDVGSENISVFAYGLEWNARYHFKLGKYFYPYVGVNAGYALARVSEDDDGGRSSSTEHLSTLGAHIGVDIPINDHVFFDVQLKYTDYDIPLDGLKLDTLRVLLGLKIKL